MKIYIDADHNGFALKAQVINYLTHAGHEVVDVGMPKLDPDDDYPLTASRVVVGMQGDHDHTARGILICGSGMGVCMAANRFKGVRAALGVDNMQAKAARNDEDSNVLCLSARQLTLDKAKTIIHIWLTTPFAAAPRYKRRIKQLDELA